MNKQLRKTLNRKLKTINSIRYINHGGCAIVALNLYKYLKAQGLKPAIIYLSSKSDYTLKSNLSNNIPDSCNHCYIQVDNYYIDSEGVITLSKFKAETKWGNCYIVTPTYLEKAVSKRYLWNSKYDRRSNRTIKAVLK